MFVMYVMKVLTANTSEAQDDLTLLIVTSSHYPNRDREVDKQAGNLKRLRSLRHPNVKMSVSKEEIDDITVAERHRTQIEDAEEERGLCLFLWESCKRCRKCAPQNSHSQIF